MRYLTIVSTAFIAATAAPAFALPWGLGIRGVEHDALVQRDVADELYTRELTALQTLIRARALARVHHTRLRALRGPTGGSLTSTLAS
ncbi:hypothetical protein EVJ58_g676 [Rhodofomes roseus]|uniref:Uncharacterized protein n=1 Tax=Rhodofomes roseus TaxID=34475 RepID=A0A4Y9Z4H7_9APHY|nr:hypothetical protein EVJ58_g676 [Rhodofomes roseus]